MLKSIQILVFLSIISCYSSKAIYYNNNELKKLREDKIQQFGMRMKDTMANCLDGKDSAFTGHRSRSSIYSEVKIKLQNLTMIYNNWLKNGNNFNGKIECQIGIKGNGKVVDVDILDSMGKNQLFTNEIINKIKEWQFTEIQPVCDVTSVVYPFVFGR
jgi:hypothetical protein